MDPLEKERLRKKMALRMGVFMSSAPTVSCVSAHWYDEPHGCELCEQVHAQELLVLRNRAGKHLRTDAKCLAEMVRFKVVDVEDLPRWLSKFSELRAESTRRREEEARQRQEERKRLERKVIVRRATDPSN